MNDNNDDHTDNDKLAGHALAMLANAIVEAVALAGPMGCPSGHIYAGVMGIMSLEAYQGVMRALVKIGRLRQEGQRYFVIPN